MDRNSFSQRKLLLFNIKFVFKKIKLIIQKSISAHCIFDQYKAVNPETAQMVPVTNTANVKVQILAHNTQNDEKAKIMEVAKIHIHPEYVEDFKLLG